MNREVLYLVGIFAVGCVAIMFRSISFNLAGERFVARLRKKVKFSRRIQNPVYYVLCYYLTSSFLPSSTRRWASLTRIGESV